MRARQVVFKVPQEFKNEITYIAHQEHRYDSDLIREAVRTYMLEFCKRENITGAQLSAFAEAHAEVNKPEYRKPNKPKTTGQRAKSLLE